MVADLCSENCGVVSMNPRISFSQDFSQTGGVKPVEGQKQQPLRSNSSGFNSSIDFDFCISESSEHESSSADELFSDGILLPTEIKKIKKNNGSLKKTNQPPESPPQHHPLPPLYANSKNSKKVSTKDVKDLMNNEEVFEKQSSKSFWSFKRSSSCGSGYARSLCPLPPIPRSNSTGSSSPPSVKRMPMSKESGSVKKSSQNERFSHSFCSNNHQKPSLRRSPGGAYANSVRVSHVLNVPSINLFGFGSIFSNNRDKSKK